MTPELPFELVDDDCGVRWLRPEFRAMDRNFRGPSDPETGVYSWPKQTAQRKARQHYNELCAAYHTGRADGIAMSRPRVRAAADEIAAQAAAE